MNISVAGVGKVGRTLVEQLVREGHNVVAIDNDDEVLEHLSTNFDVMTICGSAANRSILQEAGVPKCELHIATTGTDEMNILSCLIARRLGARHTAARVRNPEYSDQLEFMRDQLGISLAINPEHTAANEIFGTLRFPAASRIDYFNRGKVQMVEFTIESSPLDGVQLGEFYKKYQLKLLVCTVRRGERFVIPNGDFILRNGDIIELIGTPIEIEKFFRLIGALKSGVRSAMLLGGGRIAYYLARRLGAAGVNVSVVDKDPERCEELSELLPDATVIEGNGADRDLLLEEGIDSVDAFVALTGVDEENIILSMYAQSQGVGKVITKVNSADLRRLMSGFGLNSIISPRELTTNQIVRYARSLENAMGAGMETLYKICGGKAEAVEFKVQEAIPGLTGVPLRDLNPRMKRGILIATITHNEQTIIPLGGDAINAGDRVIVIAGDDQRLGDITEILA